ncbi:MAG: T9SS type A sorting domain-containing protein [Bacteroidia bacterium]
MKTVLHFFLFLLLSNTLMAQGLDLEWVKAFNNTASLSEGHNIVCDAQGNVYTLANAPTSGILFDADPDIENEAIVDYHGTVIAKYSESGDYLWSVSLGPAQESSFNIHGDICLDNSGDLVIAGSFIGDVDFDPSSNTESANSEFGTFFVAKYSPQGALLMVKTMPLSAQAFFAIKGVDTDSDGNIFVGGSILNNGILFELDFDPGPGQTAITSDEFGASFIAKYSSSGDFLFVKSIPFSSGGNQNRLIDLKLDSQDNIWITGEMNGVTDFDADEGEFIVDENGKFIFLSKYDADGNFALVKTITGPGIKFCREIAIDAFDNVYITGEFRDSLFLETNPEAYVLFSETNSEPFLAKYSNEGELIFAFDLDSDPTANEANSPRTIATDKLGYVYIAGFIRRSCDFDPSESEFILTPQGDYDVFIAKYDEQGNFIHAFNTSSSSFSYILDLDVNNLGVASAVGLFRESADFNPGIENTQTEGLSGNTMFIARYLPCFYSDDVVTICQGDIYQANTRSLSEPGSYQVSYLSNTGCDSIVSLDLTVNEIPNNAVFLNGDFAFECEQSGAEYQWFDCENNDAIAGATNQSFLPSGAGIYSVEITLNGCSVNSDCVSTDVLSMNRISDLDIKIYPNPASSNVFVQCNAGNKIELLTIQGKLINYQISTSDITELTNLPKPGIYLIRITDEKSSSITQKLILQ